MTDLTTLAATIDEAFERRAELTAKNSPPSLRHAIEVLLKRGQATGLFPHHVDPIQIYVTIAGLSWFHLSNAYAKTGTSTRHELVQLLRPHPR